MRPATTNAASFSRWTSLFHQTCMKSGDDQVYEDPASSKSAAQSRDPGQQQLESLRWPSTKYSGDDPEERAKYHLYRLGAYSEVTLLLGGTICLLAAVTYLRDSYRMRVERLKMGNARWKPEYVSERMTWTFGRKRDQQLLGVYPMSFACPEPSWTGDRPNVKAMREAANSGHRRCGKGRCWISKERGRRLAAIGRAIDGSRDPGKADDLRFVI